jgi:hypothetical protein
MNITVQVYLPTGTLDLQANVPAQKPNPIGPGDNACVTVSLEGSGARLTIPQATELVRLLSTALSALGRPV